MKNEAPLFISWQWFIRKALLAWNACFWHSWNDGDRLKNSEDALKIKKCSLYKKDLYKYILYCKISNCFATSVLIETYPLSSVKDLKNVM